MLFVLVVVVIAVSNLISFHKSCSGEDEGQGMCGFLWIGYLGGAASILVCCGCVCYCNGSCYWGSKEAKACKDAKDAQEESDNNALDRTNYLAEYANDI